MKQFTKMPKSTFNYKQQIFIIIILNCLRPAILLKNGTSRINGKENLTNNLNQKIPNTENQIRYDVPDDCRFQIISDNEISLVCSLRTINSEFDTTNFSVIPSDNTIELNVICNDDIMTKSYLDTKSFLHLNRLKVLTIKYCKLSKINADILYGLTNLKNLTIQTHNNNWSEFNLDFERDTFVSTKNLERLDLSKNNIWTLPQNLFCSMNRLILLNISENRLQDINELSFRDKLKDDDNNNKTIINTSVEILCSIDLEILDMSYNNFVLLPSNGFGVLKRLNILKLNNNEISMVADKALSGLKNLKTLYLNSNKIVALPSELFIDCSQSIQEVYLRNNSITVMSPKLFSNLKQLQALDLSLNQISSPWIDKNTFLGLIRLVLLDLSHNKITKLEPDFFLDLYTLQILNLRHNQLDNIKSNTFSLMNNLHTLLLSYNNIKILNAYSLNGLYVLSLLSIDNNQLNDIHSDAFKNCSSLQDVNLNGNKLTTIPIVLKNMRLLRTIDLGENQITNIENSAFNGLHNLYGLRLIGNNLINITSNMFNDLNSLQILNLAHNNIENIEINSFVTTPNIQAIRLDGNKLTNIQNLFVEISSLLWLNISDNNIEKFDFSQIPIGLQWLDIHKNYLTELSYDNQINNQNNNKKHRLQTLDASFNKLEKVSGNTIPNSIELLFLNDNLIKTVESNAFLDKHNLTRVDLYANQIKSLDVKSFRIYPVPDDKFLPEFYVGGNPFICDCNIEWLQKINLLTTRQYPKIMDLETIYCKLLNSREQAFVSLVNAKSKHFLCSYKTHCFALCHCCDFDACDCEMTCPNNCTCFHDQSWSTNIVECSDAGYNNEIPSNIPMDTTEVYIDGNDLIELSGHSFIGRKNLAVLFANNSNIQIIYNTTFSGLKRLIILHLEQNKIHRLYGNEFNNLENLKELFLQNNKIALIANGTFSKLEKLEIIRLDDNKLIQFEVWQLTLNSYLIQIGLAGNVWSCECSYLSRFRNYLQLNSEKIIDANRVACIYNNMSSILKEKNGTKCTLREGISTYVRASEIENLLPLLLVGTCAFIGFFGFILGLFCYRQELITLAQSSCLFKICFKSSEYIDNCNKDRYYDAYIAYSLQDENFVTQILADTLENDIGYKLSLHYRDLNLNLYITDAIIETVDSSQQAILVLSKHFLYNEWTRFEYKSALHEIINKRIKLIFVLYGDLPQRDLDVDMRHYLKTNTCIEWDDKKFWQKLRIALPHPIKRSCANKTRSSSINIYGGAHNFNTTNRRTLTKRYDCGNFARLNSCPRNFNSNFEQLSCKYNTVNSHKNNLSINTIDKKHEYAVPGASSYNVNYDRKNNESIDGCEFLLTSKCSTFPDNNRHNIQNETISNSATSACNLSINGSISSGSINVNVISSNNNANKIYQDSRSSNSNNMDECKTNKIIPTLWS